MVRKFKNTFAPNSENTEFTLSQIIAGMKYGVINGEKLPPEIQVIVKDELQVIEYCNDLILSYENI